MYAEANERERQRDHPSVMDLVFTERAMEVENIVYEPPLGKSGHVVVRLDCVAEEFVAKVDGPRKILRKQKYSGGGYKNISKIQRVYVNWEGVLNVHDGECGYIDFCRFYQ